MAAFGPTNAADETMDIQIVVTVLAGVLLAIAAIGTAYPVLPGSLLAIVTLIAWAWIVGSPEAWTAAVIAPSSFSFCPSVRPSSRWTSISGMVSSWLTHLRTFDINLPRTVRSKRVPHE